jgi:hypothetical protein
VVLIKVTPIQGIAVTLILLGVAWWNVPNQTMYSDEKVYLGASAAWDLGLKTQPEHPYLVKAWYNLLLTPEYKAGLNANPDFHESRLLSADYNTPATKEYAGRGILYLRYVNGLLIAICLLLVYYHSKDFWLYISLFMVLFLGGAIFTAMLDGWLFVFGVLGYYLVSKGNTFGWALTLAAAPVSKLHGFVFALWSLRKSKDFFAASIGLCIIAVSMLFLYGLPAFMYSLNVTRPQFAITIFYPITQLRFLLPYSGLLVLEYFEYKNRGR